MSAMKKKRVTSQRRDSRREPKQAKKQDWAVFVKPQPTMHKGSAHQAVFRSGVQYFAIGYECSEDEGGRNQARWFVKMFLKALENIGVRTKTRKRR